MSRDRPHRVLFVDDEQRIVDGLQRLFRPHRAQWEVTTCTSPVVASGMLGPGRFDVVVSDMRMPEMDGAALLAVAKEKCPGTARVILSGQTDAETAMRTINVAHQFLSKPTDPAVLLATLGRLAATYETVGDPAVLTAVGSLHSLPSVPRLCGRLAALVSSDELTVKALAGEIENEPAIVLKLLQLVNSAFFGLRRQMSSVTEAVAYLGTDLIKNLVVSLSVVNSLPVRASSFDAEAFQRRAVDTAALARAVVGSSDTVTSDVAFVAGMLHEIGKLTMAHGMPALYDRLVRASRAAGRTFEEEEQAAGAVGHAKMGAYLLDLWGLPYAVVEALAGQSRVLEETNTEVTAADALYVARRLVDGPLLPNSDPERAYLARIGLAARVPDLAETTRKREDAA